MVKLAKKFLFQEVDIPALKPEAHVERKLNSVINGQEVLSVSSSVNGVVKVSSLDFILPAGSGNFSVSLLHDLPLSAFTTRPDCVTIYRPVEHNLFIGIYPDCSGRLEPQTTPLPFIVSCNAITFVGGVTTAPLAAASNIPYSVWKINRDSNGL